MTGIERLLATAGAEVGYLEKASNSQLDDKTANAGQANFTKYARDLDRLGVYHAAKNGLSWCDIFVDWCFVRTFGLETGMKMTGQPMGGYGAGCTESANYYKQMGRFHRRGPQPGDQVFFTYDNGRTMAHTGIVERVDKGRLYTIEGVVPNLLHLPKGCSFCTRCDQAQERCFVQKPCLYEAADGHGVRCFQYESGGQLDE